MAITDPTRAQQTSTAPAAAFFADHQPKPLKNRKLPHAVLRGSELA